MNLTFATQSGTLERNEDDPVVISTLKRKGWQEVAPAPKVEEPPEVPDEVPLWAFRSVLDIAKLTDSVTTILEAVPGEAGVIARNQWEYATVAERDNETISALASQLGLSSSQVDQYFIQAAELVES